MGQITLITGPMFSGKSRELIKKANLMAEFSSGDIVFIRPNTDTRDFLTRDKIELDKRIPIIKAEEIPDIELIKERYRNLRYVFVDEGQFFQNIYQLNQYADNGIEVYVAALMYTSEFKWFFPIIDFYPSCDNLVKLKARCSNCGSSEGVFTKCVKDKIGDILIDDSAYVTLCRKCCGGVYHDRNKETFEF